MKKGLVLIHNKDERATARQILTSVDSLTMSSNLQDGFAELKKNPAEISLLILDERFDQSMDSRNANLKIVDLLDFFQEVRPLNAVVMVILNESTTALEVPIHYAELGADVFLHRPFGIEELRERLSEAVSWMDSPPPLVKLTRVISEHVRKGNYAEVMNGLESLHQMHPKNVRLGMLLAKVLVEQGGQHRVRGIEVARGYDESHPASLFAKKLLVSAYESERRIPEAFSMALRLYALNPSDVYFEKCLSLAERLSHEDPTHFAHWNDFLKTFLSLEAIRTKDRRIQVLKRLTELHPPADFMHALFDTLNQGFEDVLPDIRSSLDQWIQILKTACQQSMEKKEHFEPTLVMALRKSLEIDPASPASIELFTDILIERKDYKLAAKYLQKAKDEKKPSVEFYASYVKLSLAEGMLKDASDMLHAGRRLSPSDDRWEPLAKIWQEKYNASQG